MKVKKAIVAVAGSGTRFLPVTKAMPKEMLPIVDKPIIQLVVEELVEAGIEDIILVTKWDKKPLEDHFDHSLALEDELEKAGKMEKLEEIKRVSEMANFIYIRQKGPYGNGTPVLTAASLVDDEPLVFVWGDDLVKSKISFTKQMVDEFEKTGLPMIGVQKVSKEDVVRYGIVKLRENTNEIEDIIEKPSVEEAPSQLADFGRMILNQGIIDVLKNTALGKGNELWITDAIKQYVQKGNIFLAKEVEGGEWLTTGDPLNYLKALLAYAAEREDIGKELKEYTPEIILLQAMKIAINAADLDHSRIDGTRIYIQNLLKEFGLLEKKDRFLIYHKKNFNPELKFPVYEDYEIRKIPFPFWWTQTAFAFNIFRKKTDVLWMPMHSLPVFRSKKTKTVVTIHDLAFKFFPDHFVRRDLRRLNFFTDYAVNNADKLIAISHSTKKDLLKIYPKIREHKIRVIYHGYDQDLFRENVSRQEIGAVREKYKINCRQYLIFVGAIQPRKNIDKLLEVYEIIKRQKKYEDLGSVIAGSPGWLSEGLVKKIKSISGVVLVENFQTKDLPGLLSGAEIFVLPSLYEGFGLPVIEAMACGVPVAVANNSSLSEIVENAGVVFDPNPSEDVAEKLLEILESEQTKKDLQKRSLERAKYFSWEKCAKETLEWLRS